MDRENRQIQWAEQQLAGLKHCRVNRAFNLARKWAAPAFNNWYCPAVRRGYTGPLAHVLDIGLLLFAPGVSLKKVNDPFNQFLGTLQSSPLVAETIAPLVNNAPAEHRPQIEWILIENVLRAMGGYWQASQWDYPQPLPRLVQKGDEVLIVPREGEEAARKVDFARLAEEEEVEEPASDPGPFPPSAPISALRVFMAHMAGYWEDVDSILDFEVVEACLRGPNLRTEEHEPPPIQRSEISTRSKSILPGPIAGVTRISVKKPDDPIYNVLPSEMALLRKHPQAGLANLLFGKPLVVEHEIEKDRIPKHRVLVCFIVDAYVLGSKQVRSSSVLHGYRHDYVYAKRQVFDLLRDLREAEELIRLRTRVEIDVALFAMSPDREEAAACYKFSLNRIQDRSGRNALVDRLVQLISLANVAPEFFNRAASHSLQRKGDGDPASRLVDPHVGRYLRREARNGAYRTINIVPIGLENLSGFIAAANRYFSFESAARHQILIITPDTRLADSDPRLQGLDEPQWKIGKAQTLNQTLRLMAGESKIMELGALRRHFVETVIGELKETKAGNRRIVKLAQVRG